MTTLTPDQINRHAHPQRGSGRFRNLVATVANAPAIVNTKDGTVEVYVGPELTRWRMATAEEVQQIINQFGS